MIFFKPTMTGVFGELAKVGSQYVASGSHATSRVEPSVDGVDGVDGDGMMGMLYPVLFRGRKT